MMRCGRFGIEFSPVGHRPTFSTVEAKTEGQSTARNHLIVTHPRRFIPGTLESTRRTWCPFVLRSSTL